MSRQEDFIEAGIAYRFEHGKPMAIGGDNFADVANEMNRTKPFEAGAEYGYQYALQHPHWIPVEERLPEEVSEIHHCSTDVLIGYFADGDNYQTTARYNCKEKVWCDADDWGEIDFPTHWMPLPAAPRKEE